MNFITNDNAFLKSNNTTSKIFINVLLSLIPLIVYYLFINNINYIINFTITTLSIFISSFIYNLLIKKQKIKVENYMYPLIISIIICMLMPNNSNFILLFFTSFISVLINKIFKNINPVLLVLIFNYMFFISDINTNIIFPTPFVPLFLLIISYIYLLIKRAIKFRISGICIIFSIIGYLLKLYDINILVLLLIIDVYLVPEFYGAPNLSICQILYAIIIGISSLFVSYNYLFMILLAFNVLNIYLDMFFATILANNKKI